MFDKIKQLYTEWKIKYTLLRDLSPTRKHILTAHAAFLDEVEKQFPFQQELPRRQWMGYALAAVAGIFILNGGAVTYADTSDVPLSHPLYSYKRLAEEVRIKTAPVEKQPEIEVKVAQRRMKELKQLAVVETNEPDPTNSINSVNISATSTATSTGKGSIQKKINKIVIDKKTQKQLTENIKKHIESVEKIVEKGNKSKKSTKKQILRKTSVCAELNAMTTDVSSLFNDEDDAQKIKAKIAKICISDENKSEINTGTSTTTTTTSNTTIKKQEDQKATIKDSIEKLRDRNRSRNRD